MIGASFSRSGIACAKPKSSAATISRFGFQFDRISAASAMNPRPSGLSLAPVLVDLDRQERAGEPGERAGEHHALRSGAARPARRASVVASGFSPARPQPQAPPRPVQRRTTPGTPSGTRRSPSGDMSWNAFPRPQRQLDSSGMSIGLRCGSPGVGLRRLTEEDLRQEPRHARRRRG